MANGRCRLHGGASPPGGPGHHAWKSGAGSKWVPRKLREQFESALHDDQLLSMREEIAATRALLRDTFEQIDGRWADRFVTRAVQQLYREWAAYEECIETGGHGEGLPAIAQARRKVGEQIERLGEATAGAKDSARIRKEFRETALVYERLERSENQRMTDLYSMITTERAYALRMAEHQVFMDALQHHVQDREIIDAVRRAVAAGLERIAHGRDHHALAPSERPSEQSGDPAPSD